MSFSWCDRNFPEHHYIPYVSSANHSKNDANFILGKKANKINEFSTVKKTSTNLTLSDVSNTKKKRFSIQKCSPVEQTNLTLDDLPLLPLSYICTNLTIAEREMFSGVCTKFAIANKISWLRRSRLNIRSDIASYILQDGIIDDLDDEWFDFVSMNLLMEKVQFISSYFTGPRLSFVDYSLPKNSLDTRKWGEIILLNRESFRQSMLKFRQNIFELNLCDAVVTKEVLNECSILCPDLVSISLSIHTLIWRQSSELHSSDFEMINSETIKNWKQLNKNVPPNVADLLSFLYRRFRRLKHVNLFD